VVLATIANTIFGSFLVDRVVNWDLLIHKLVGKLVSVIEKGKPFLISSYLFHLYDKNKCFKEAEIDKLKISRSLSDFNIKSKEVTSEELIELEESTKEATLEVQRTTMESRKKPTYRTKEAAYIPNS